jgi:hypothetical protein
MARKILAKKLVSRKKGKLYFIDGSGNVVETDMNRKGGKKGRTVCGTKKRKPAKRKKSIKSKTGRFYSAADGFMRQKKRSAAAKKGAATRRRNARKTTARKRSTKRK